MADYICEPPSPPSSRLHTCGLACCCRFIAGEKLTVPTDESFASCVEEQLDAVKETLLQEAEANLAKG